MLVLTACGRVAFDPRTDASPPDADTCAFSDDFESGAGAWLDASGQSALQPTLGFAGTTGFGALTTTSLDGALVAHPMMMSVDEAHLAVDFRMEDPSGDFNVLFYRPGWVGDESDGYDVSFVAQAGDTPIDRIARTASGAELILAMRTPTVPINTWAHADIRRFADGSFVVELDGAPYLSSPPNADWGPPLEIVFRFYGRAFMDNVTFSCAP